MTMLSTRCGGRRPKSAKARNRAIPDAMIVTDQDGKTLAAISILDVLRKRRRDG
jgi:hypothetical protein